MCVNNLPKVATQWNSGATREWNPGPRDRIPSAITTRPLSHTVAVVVVAIVVVKKVEMLLEEIWHDTVDELQYRRLCQCFQSQQA